MKQKYADPFRRAGDRPHIVIAYSYADHDFAYKLAGALRRDRITPWIDEVDMSAGQFLVNRISHPSRPVDSLVPVISAASVGARWVQHELKTALTMVFDRRRISVLPARVDDSALPDFLASGPHFDFLGSGWSLAYDDLTVAVQRRSQPITVTGQTPTLRLPRPARLT